MYDRAQIHYGLGQQRPDEDDWEPPQLDGLPQLEEIRHQISLLEDEIRSKGKFKLSGHVIMACHTLPYVCNLNIDPIETNSINPSNSSGPPSDHPASANLSLPLDISTLTSNNINNISRSHQSTKTDLAHPDPEPASVKTCLPLEIRPGDRLTHPQSLHSPTTSLTPSHNDLSLFDHDYSHKKSDSLQSNRHLAINPIKAPSLLNTSKPNSRPPTPAHPLSSFTEDDSVRSSSVSLSTHLNNQDRSGFKWVLEPRRGHAALNAGIKSLSTFKSLTLCAYPADLRLTTCGSLTSEPIETSKLTEAHKLALDCGLRQLGSVTEEEDDQISPQNLQGSFTPKKGIECVPVWLDDRSAGLHYEGFCKQYLWPIFHYMPLSEHQDKVKEKLAWKAYEQVNYAFACQIAKVYQPDDLIYIQDYHLLLVPRMLRKMLPKCHVGLFLHSPFPSSEFFRCLPRREEILDGMLGSDLICFQTYSYGRHFVSACIRVMGYEAVGGGIESNGMTTVISHCPIGIDAERIDYERQLPGVEPKMEALRKLYEGKKIIIGRDKLDPTKGVLPKLKAFEVFLKRYPQWRNKVVLIQVTSPSPTDSPQLATNISKLVDHINATYGTLHFQPVHHYHQTIERDEYLALLSVADLAVITSVRDGMNTTSMEYAICQKESQNPLILSEFTGVTGSMKSAIKINPWDLGDVAKAIDQCLSMSKEEKAQRHTQLYSRVKSHSSAVWASTLLLQLLYCLRSDQTKESVKLLDEANMIKKYQQASKRLLLFDYDGTLTPIVKNPKDAVPPPGLIEALERLCADEKNIVYIISGRDGTFLQKHLGSIPNLGMSAEHGCYLREPGSKDWIDLTENIDMSWMDDVAEIFKYYEARTLGAFVEKKVSSVTWHFRNANPEFGLFQAKELQALLESMQERLPIDILKGKKNIECRPAHTNKGEIVKRLLYTSPDVEFALCVGDDKTDEDMFRALKMLRSNASFDSHHDGHTHPTTIEPPQTLSLYPILARSSSIGAEARSSRDRPTSNERQRNVPQRHYSSNASMHSAFSSHASPVPCLSPTLHHNVTSSNFAMHSNVLSTTPSINQSTHQFSPKLEPVESVLEPESIFSVVIDENESRKTLAEYRLGRPLELVAVLSRLSIC